MKRLISMAAIIAFSIGLGSCQRDDGEYLAIQGKIFIFNVRLAKAYYQLALERKANVPDGAIVIARFENPAGGAMLEAKQKVFPAMTRIDLNSPDLRCVVKDRPYAIEIELVAPDGKVLQKIVTSLSSTLDQTVLPAVPLVVGPAYEKNEDAIGADGKYRLADNDGCPK